ncbi:P-II family nitrogen regulator [Enterococcus hulanensis]|uniref:P-II family nitrogen regulator n=1 Tax=Enterococcus hulanensis TaxID=2559929 RepID=A0ABU3F1T0_9ENTE|nr:P-II family nitrogen regulator [Enterococcus hulanensis]MDT2600468.1 P-II family nitrogen regulator [Enterococcus hulanensis]MDT2609794.1 P-II family nitrogen regulator [Enterococcus hulanensis]MDT2617578.1 P-II family nitrogen regulator [Enterococcus hulanensis]MDT2628803.1 P-II family nitrogen regulator [Enterococcus hulanensis]MDT2656143.1 P-II family nitrogen regulator [Enterococcus hulanensis]
MKKVEAIIRQEKLEAIKAVIDQEIEVNGMTVSQVLGCGLQKGQKSHVRGQEIITTLLPKVSVSFILADDDVDRVIDLILETCQSEECGTGKIFVYPIEEVIRIRTRETGKAAIQ